MTEGYGVWWLVLHCRPAVVRRLKTQTGTLSEVKPVIKWMHSMSGIAQIWNVTRKRKHARDCRQPRSHTLRRESHEERGSVNYEGPLFGLATGLPKEPHELEYSRIHGRQARREATRCSPKGLVGVSEDQVAGVQGCVIHVGYRADGRVAPRAGRPASRSGPGRHVELAARVCYHVDMSRGGVGGTSGCGARRKVQMKLVPRRCGASPTLAPQLARIIESSRATTQTGLHHPTANPPQQTRRRPRALPHPRPTADTDHHPSSVARFDTPYPNPHSPSPP
jgi:hypothetical protein